MKKRYTSLLPLVCLLCALPLGMALAAYSGGDGSAENPYLISSREDLLAFQAQVNGGDGCTGLHFALTQDIVLNEALSLDLEWTPLYPFNGVLDGRGHAICGLYVPDVYDVLHRCIQDGTATYNKQYDSYSLSEKYRPLGWGSGLFSRLAGTVRNLTVSGRVDSPWYGGESGLAGGIAGENDGLIDGCSSYITFYVSSECPSDFGGIAATNSSIGTIQNCLDQSSFYMNPAIEEQYDGYFDDYIHYGGIAVLRNWDNSWGDRPDDLNGVISNCTDHSRHMGRGVPQSWNEYRPIATIAPTPQISPPPTPVPPSAAPNTPANASSDSIENEVCHTLTLRLDNGGVRDGSVNWGNELWREYILQSCGEMSLDNCGIERRDYRLTGWINAKNPKEFYSPDATVILSEDLTLIAQWESTLPDIRENSGAYLAVTDPQGNPIDGERLLFQDVQSELSFLVASSFDWSLELPKRDNFSVTASPVRGKKNTVSRVTLTPQLLSGTEAELTLTVKAQGWSGFLRYQKLSASVTLAYEHKPPEIYWIGLDAGAKDAIWAPDATTVHGFFISEDYPIPFSVFDKVERPNYTFVGWMDEAGGIHKSGEIFTATADTAFKAVWHPLFSSTEWLWPIWPTTNTKKINSPFTLGNFAWILSRYHAVSTSKKPLFYGEHNAIDINAPTGSGVYAARSGVVEKVNATGSLCIRHLLTVGNEDKTLYSNYVHLQPYSWKYAADCYVYYDESRREYCLSSDQPEPGVAYRHYQAGQTIKKGDYIATGMFLARNVKGHLHFAIGSNPAYISSGPSLALSSSGEADAFKRQRSFLSTNPMPGSQGISYNDTYVKLMNPESARAYIEKNYPAYAKEASIRAYLNAVKEKTSPWKIAEFYNPQALRPDAAFYAGSGNEWMADYQISYVTDKGFYQPVPADKRK